MTTTILHPRYQKKIQEVYSLQPNTLGPAWLTLLYRKTTAPLKSMPFLYIIPLATIGAFLIYLLLGKFAIALVSVLQYSF